MDFNLTLLDKILILINAPNRDIINKKEIFTLSLQVKYLIHLILRLSSR